MAWPRACQTLFEIWEEVARGIGNTFPLGHRLLGIRQAFLQLIRARCRLDAPFRAVHLHSVVALSIQSCASLGACSLERFDLLPCSLQVLPHSFKVIAFPTAWWPASPLPMWLGWLRHSWGCFRFDLGSVGDCFINGAAWCPLF